MSRAHNRRAHDVIVFASPGALEAGGGIGRMTGYIVDQMGRSRGDVRHLVLDTRGGGSVLWSPWHLMATVVRLTALALAGRVRLVHINVSERASIPRKAAVLLAARLLSCPAVVHLHGASFIDNYLASPLTRVVSRWLFATADLVIVLSDATREFLVHRIGIDGAKVRVLYNAVPDFAGADSPRQPPEPCPDRPLRLLMLANLSERKGVGTLLSACHRLARDGLPFHLTLGGGGDIKGYRRLAQTLGIEERCTFLGWVSRERAHELVHASDLLLLPSTHEGLPMVILEALCARLPVITTPIGAIPEALRHNQTAWFVPVEDAAALAAAISTLAGDPALYRRLSEAGRRHYLERFDIERYCAELMTLYETVTGPKETGSDFGGAKAGFQAPRRP
jgi:glycosyltransferase involved in cell wall biosynthesis